MEMEQQFSLSWNNFHGNLSKGFAGLLGNGEFVDVTIAVDGHLLQAHKVILSICSPYFKKMFQLNPCQHPIVVLRDVSHKAMKDLLQFMYHGEVSVKREDLTSFIGTAEVLQIKGLTNKQTDNENCESGKELQTNEIVTKENTTSIETDAHERKKSSPDIDILKQKEFIDRLQKLNHLKRKSEEYLQKSYFSSDSMSLERRSKREKTLNKISDRQTNNYDLFNHVYDDNPLPLDASTNYKSQSKHDSRDSSKNDVDKESISYDSNLDIKTECDENDIIVTDPACMTPKSYEMARDNQKDNDYQSPQNNCANLNSLFTDLKSLVNGKVANDQDLSRLGSFEDLSRGMIEHRLITIPQKEDGKKKYPQRSCRLCWKIGKRRDTRFMCGACELPFCKSPCFEIHFNNMLKASQMHNYYFAS